METKENVAKETVWLEKRAVQKGEEHIEFLIKELQNMTKRVEEHKQTYQDEPSLVEKAKVLAWIANHLVQYPVNFRINLLIGHVGELKDVHARKDMLSQLTPDSGSE